MVLFVWDLCALSPSPHDNLYSFCSDTVIPAATPSNETSPSKRTKQKQDFFLYRSRLQPISVDATLSAALASVFSPQRFPWQPLRSCPSPSAASCSCCWPLECAAFTECLTTSKVRVWPKNQLAGSSLTWLMTLFSMIRISFFPPQLVVTSHRTSKLHFSLKNLQGDMTAFTSTCSPTLFSSYSSDMLPPLRPARQSAHRENNSFSTESDPYSQVHLLTEPHSLNGKLSVYWPCSYMPSQNLW